MRPLPLGVWLAMRAIDQSAGHKLSAAKWQDVHTKTRQWLIERDLVEVTKTGFASLTKRGQLVFNAAEVVNFWARSD